MKKQPVGIDGSNQSLTRFIGSFLQYINLSIPFTRPLQECGVLWTGDATSESSLQLYFPVGNN